MILYPVSIYHGTPDWGRESGKYRHDWYRDSIQQDTLCFRERRSCGTAMPCTTERSKQVAVSRKTQPRMPPFCVRGCFFAGTDVHTGIQMPDDPGAFWQTKKDYPPSSRIDIWNTFLQKLKRQKILPANVMNRLIAPGQEQMDSPCSMERCRAFVIRFRSPENGPGQFCPKQEEPEECAGRLFCCLALRTGKYRDREKAGQDQRRQREEMDIPKRKNGETTGNSQVPARTQRRLYQWA